MNVCYLWVLGAVIAFSSSSFAQSVHGVLRVVKGDVQIKSAKQNKTVKARVGEKVYPKDVILTGADSRAKIVMVDNNELNVSPDSQVEIQHYEFDPAAGKKEVLLNVIYGKVRSKVEQKYDGKTSKFQVKTPSAVAGVRGTDFLTGFANGATNIVTFEGKVEFGLPAPGGGISNPVTVTPGTSASNTVGANPTPPAPVPKDQLAKMDADTKAEAPKGAPGAGPDSRAPADDSKDKKENKENKENKDKNDGGKKAEGEGKKADGKPSNDRKTADNDGKGRGPDGRGPGGPNPGPTPECPMCDMDPLPPPIPPPPVALPQVPTGPGLINQPCDACRVGTEQGTSKVIIHVNTGP